MATQEQYFAYLEELRSSGVTNMLGAGPFLEVEFDLDKREANKVLVQWIESKSKGGK